MAISDTIVIIIIAYMVVYQLIYQRNKMIGNFFFIAIAGGVLYTSGSQGAVYGFIILIATILNFLYDWILSIDRRPGGY